MSSGPAGLPGVADCRVGGHEIHGAAYELRDGTRCLRHALRHRPTLCRSARVAAVVGTALLAINQLDVLVRGHVTPLLVGKIVLTYCVPFCVATFGALAGARRAPDGPAARERGDRSGASAHPSVKERLAGHDPRPGA